MIRMMALFGFILRPASMGRPNPKPTKPFGLSGIGWDWEVLHIAGPRLCDPDKQTADLWKQA